MSTYVIIEGDLPQDLKKGEMVLTFPTFAEELKEEAARAVPGRKLTTANILSKVISNIGRIYDPSFDYTRIPYGDYAGREFHTVEDLSTIVCEIFSTWGPNMFRAALDKKIKNRPLGTKVIYYKGPFSFTDVFDRNGLTHINERQVEDILGIKRKGLTSPLKKEENISQTKKTTEVKK